MTNGIAPDRKTTRPFPIYLVTLSHPNAKIQLCVNVGFAENAPDADFLFSLPGLGDVVGRLQPHERVHLHPESLLDAQRHIAGQVGLAVKQTGQGRAGNLQRGGGCRDRQTSRLDDLCANKIAGMRRILHGHSCFSFGLVVSDSLLNSRRRFRAPPCRC